MAYWIHESGNKNNSLWRSYMCDHISDLNDLPTQANEGKPQPNDTVCKYRCAPGSQCLCLEDGSIWVLGKDDDKWIKRTLSVSGGGSNGDVDNIEPIPVSSIQSLFS